MNGVLVERHDAREVADAIARVLGDRASRQRLGAAARVRARAFAVEPVVAAYDRLFQRLMEMVA